MAVLKIFRIKDNDKKSDHASVEGSLSTATSSDSKKKSSSKGSRSKPKNGDESPTTPPAKKSKKIQIVESFLHLMSNFTTVDDMLSYFVHKGAMFVPEDVDPIPVKKFASLFQHLHEGFPDMFFTYKSVHEHGNNVIVVEHAQFSGTHTGTAYSPLPKKMTSIATSGKRVVVDEERYFFEFEGEKFKRFEVVALGPCTGPMGVYEKLNQLLNS